MRKVTFSLDEETFERLERLARRRSAARSGVVRDAIRLLWEADALESRIATLDTDPEIQAILARAIKEARSGRVIDPEEVERKFRRRRR